MNTTTSPTPTIYIDIDGTILGKNASLLHDHQGNRTTSTIDAIAKAESAHADLVISTGRDVYRTSEFCRSIGITKYIAEMGCVLNTTGQDIIERGELATAFVLENKLDTTQFLDCVHQGAQMLIDTFADSLELHSPYNRDSFASYKLRGNIDVEISNQLLNERGWPFLELIPNGYGMFRRTMPSVDHVLIYHLSPKGVNKAFGIQRDQQLRSLDPQHCYVIGDSLSDAQCSDVVRNVYVPANGPTSDPNITTYVQENKSVIVLEESHNIGFAKAIDLILSNYRS